jgi:hypothetical protein
MALVPEARTFTLFPKLPKELRIAIWEETANLPRNLDVWCSYTGEGVYQSDTAIVLYNKFEFTTRQPIPGVLLANKESREAAQKYFEMSFGVEIPVWEEVDDDDEEAKVVLPPRILRNVQADRICPMGPALLFKGREMWRHNAPKRCAFNVARELVRQGLMSHFNDLMISMKSSTNTFPISSFPTELLLYYCKRSPTISGERSPAINGPFDFMEILEEQSDSDEWATLEKAKSIVINTVNSRMPGWTSFMEEKAEQINTMRQQNQDVAEAMLSLEQHLASRPTLPSIRFVALIIDGIRY